MKKSTILSLFALLIAIAGLMIALIAYFKKRNCVLCDDLDDMVEFYDDDEDECDGDCCCGGDCHGTAPTADPAASTPTASPEV